MGTDGDKLLTKEEWRNMMVAEGSSAEDADNLFLTIDQSRSGSISLAEFDLYIKNLTMMAVREKFIAADKDKSGQIEKKEFWWFFMEQGLSRNEIALLWKKIDTDRSGTVSYKEFDEYISMELSSGVIKGPLK